MLLTVSKRTTLIIKIEAFDTLNGHDSDSADLSFLRIDSDLRTSKNVFT